VVEEGDLLLQARRSRLVRFRWATRSRPFFGWLLGRVGVEFSLDLATGITEVYIQESRYRMAWMLRSVKHFDTGFYSVSAVC